MVRCPGSVSVIVQINELIGTQNCKRLSHAKMWHQMNRLSTMAASSFEDSILRFNLWSKLLQLSPNREVAERVLSARSKLTAVTVETGIQLNLDALMASDRELFDEVAISDYLQAVIGWSSVDFGEQHSLFGPSQEERTISEASLRRIQRAGRQEDRLAIALDELLKSDVGQPLLLRQYARDRAQLADWAIRTISAERTNDVQPFTYITEREVADLVSELYSVSFPMNRGYLLLALSRHLGKYTEIKLAIRNILTRTHSWRVEEYRQEIEECLDK